MSSREDIVVAPVDKVKDAILNAHNCIFSQQLYHGKNGTEPISNETVEGAVGDIYKAMDEYAKQEAIAYSNFIQDNSYTKSPKSGWYKYYTQSKEYNGFTFSSPVYEFLTEEELYILYLQSKTKQ